MILFICHGNVTRSQFAEAIALKKGFTNVISAGTHVSTARQDNCLINDGLAAENAVQCFRQITGIDISLARRKQVTPEMIDHADLIVVITNIDDLPDFALSQKNKCIF
jgi:protein-tyrosine-phosphatase